MSHSEGQGPFTVHSSGMEGPACLTLRVKVHLLSILVEWTVLHVSLRVSRSTCCPCYYVEGPACLTLRVKVHLLSILVDGGSCMSHSES